MWYDVHAFTSQEMSFNIYLVGTNRCISVLSRDFPSFLLLLLTWSSIQHNLDLHPSLANMCRRNMGVWVLSGVPLGGEGPSPPLAFSLIFICWGCADLADILLEVLLRRFSAKKKWHTLASVCLKRRMSKGSQRSGILYVHLQVVFFIINLLPQNILFLSNQKHIQCTTQPAIGENVLIPEWHPAFHEVLKYPFSKWLESIAFCIDKYAIFYKPLSETSVHLIYCWTSLDSIAAINSRSWERNISALSNLLFYVLTLFPNHW